MAMTLVRLHVCLMCYIAVTTVAGQVNLGQTARDGNSITLQCTDTNDEPIANAVFYRNGAPVADDPCFNDSMASGSMITITVSPPCEGYFMCGQDGGTVVSLPKPKYANPRRTLANEDMVVVAGSNVTLPCNVQRPFLNEYTVTWTRNINGGTNNLGPLPPGQFDLELANVLLSDNSAEYKCTVETSINQPNNAADAVSTITLTVTKSHIPATIDSDIRVDDAMYQFTVDASGTSPLSYTWYINNTIQNSGIRTCDTVPCTITYKTSINFTQGQTEVRVQISNHDDSTGVTFSDNSTLVIYMPVGTPTPTNSPVCTTLETTGGILMLVIIIALVIVTVLLVLFILYRYIIYTKKSGHIQLDDLDESPATDALTLKIGEKIITLTEDNKSNVAELVHALEIGLHPLIEQLPATDDHRLETMRQLNAIVLKFGENAFDDGQGDDGDSGIFMEIFPTLSSLCTN